MTELKDIQEKVLIRIVDDDEGLREALGMLLMVEGWNAKGYRSAEEFLTRDAPSVPGCIILDYLMPGANGVELQRILSDRGHRLPAVMLTGHADVDIAVASFKAGAVDFLKKPVNEDELLQSVERFASASYFESIGLPSEEQFRRMARSLTDRERTVFLLMVQGVGTKGIAERLGLSDRTVYEYRTDIYRKLGIKKFGMIPPEWLQGLYG